MIAGRKCAVDIALFMLLPIQPGIKAKVCYTMSVRESEPDQRTVPSIHDDSTRYFAVIDFSGKVPDGMAQNTINLSPVPIYPLYVPFGNTAAFGSFQVKEFQPI